MVMKKVKCTDQNLYFVRKFGRKFTAQIDTIILKQQQKDFESADKIYDYVFIKNNVVDEILTEIKALKNGYINNKIIRQETVKHIRDTQIYYYYALIEGLKFE